MEPREEIPPGPRRADLAESDSREVLPAVRLEPTWADLRADITHGALVVLRVGGLLLFAALAAMRFRESDEHGQTRLVYYLDLAKIVPPGGPRHSPLPVGL